MDVYKGREIGEPREANLGSKVVLKLSEPFQKSERNITSDNFFTNLELGRKLLQNLTIMGTIRKNRKELPAEFMSTKDRKKFTTLYGYQKETIIASYCPKKGKMVTLLSTMHLDKGTESPGPEKKPEVITYYNAKKGGVDTMDQMVRWFTTKRKTRRWATVIFYNGYQRSKRIFCCMSFNKKNYTAKRGNRLRRSLLISLAKELAGLQDKDAIQISASSPANTKKQKRCSMCPPKAQHKTKTQKQNHAIAIFALIILSLFAESVGTNNHKLFFIRLHYNIVTHIFVYHVFSAGINTYMNYVQCTYLPKC